MANEIVEFDLQDIRDADLLLVNYSKASIGTAMEIFYASHDLGKFVIAFSPLASLILRPGWSASAPKSCPTSKALSPTSNSTSSEIPPQPFKPVLQTRFAIIRAHLQ